MSPNRLFPILLLVLLAVPAIEGTGSAAGARWWETIGAPLDHQAQEGAPGSGFEQALRVLRSGERSAPKGPSAAALAGLAPRLAPVSLVTCGRASGWTSPVRPFAERLPYHSTAPPVLA
jgi:hypothetical protein